MSREHGHQRTNPFRRTHRRGTVTLPTNTNSAELPVSTNTETSLSPPPVRTDTAASTAPGMPATPTGVWLAASRSHAADAPHRAGGAPDETMTPLAPEGRTRADPPLRSPLVTRSSAEVTSEAVQLALPGVVHASTKPFTRRLPANPGLPPRHTPECQGVRASPSTTGPVSEALPLVEADTVTPAAAVRGSSTIDELSGVGNGCAQGDGAAVMARGNRCPKHHSTSVGCNSRCPERATGA